MCAALREEWGSSIYCKYKRSEGHFWPRRIKCSMRHWGKLAKITPAKPPALHNFTSRRNFSPLLPQAIIAFVAFLFRCSLKCYQCFSIFFILNFQQRVRRRLTEQTQSRSQDPLAFVLHMLCFNTPSSRRLLPWPQGNTRRTSAWPLARDHLMGCWGPLRVPPGEPRIHGLQLPLQPLQVIVWGSVACCLLLSAV